MSANVCWNCPDRAVGCHGQCPKWAAYVEKRDAEYERRRVELLCNYTPQRELYNRNQAFTARERARRRGEL